MSTKIISNLIGVSFELAEDTRNEQEDYLFNKYPFLNAICIVQIFKNKEDQEGSFILEAGVTNLQETDQIPIENGINNGVPNSGIQKNGDFNKNLFPSFLFANQNLKGNDYTFKIFDPNYESTNELSSTSIPFIQKQINPSISQNRNRVRPLKKGINIGDKYDSKLEGTLGAICKLKGFSGHYALSNWHVMVGSGGHNPNTEIMQPFQETHRFNEADAIGKVVWYCLDRYRDLALAKLNDKIPIQKEDPVYGIINNETSQTAIGDNLFCKGANGAYNGKILSSNCSVRINKNYTTTTNRPGYFILRDQVITEKISVGGDSGSLVINKATKKIVGLIVAGDAKKFSVVCKINFDVVPKNRHNNPAQKFHCKTEYLNNIEIATFL